MDELSDRVMALEGPSFTIEQEIGRLINPQATRLSVFPAYTASLDAAMSLVLEGEAFNVMRAVDGLIYATVSFDRPTQAATPALALCAAALKSRGL